MAPGFFSKFKPQSGSRLSSESQSRSGSPSDAAAALQPSDSARTRALSTPARPPELLPHPPPSFQVTPPQTSPVPSNGSLHSEPSVTVIPPSPQSHAGSFQSDTDHSYTTPERPRVNRPAPLTGLDDLSAPESDSGMPTPTPSSNQKLGVNANGSARPLTPSSSTGNLRDRVRSVVSRSSSRSRSRTAKQEPASPPAASDLHRAATVAGAGPGSAAPPNGHGLVIMPMVDSPTNSGEFQVSPISTAPTPTQARAATIASPPESRFLTPDRGRDPDSISIASTASGRKRRLWRRSSTAGPQASPKRKPTGLASALAASGLSMVNPGAPPAAIVSTPSRRSTGGSSPPASPPRRKGSVVKRSPALSGHRAAASQSSVDSNALQLSPQALRSRQDSLSARPFEESDYVSSADGRDEDEDEDDSDDDALLADLNDGDIPVTGFAVASNKRNADFHELFRTIPEGDYLIEDYGCALQREILIQGRIYISENHICFHANIFGWITDLIIPIYDIISLEKKMTAFVIPNAIQIATRNTKYTFASFLARDTVYDVIYNIWRLARPEDGLEEDESAGRSALETARTLSQAAPAGTTAAPVGAVEMPVHKVTQCACGKEGRHYSETPMDVVLPGTPERLYNLMFASGFIKDFMRVDQKLEDIQISDWTPSPADQSCLARNMSYIKPLNGSIGPRSTKCEIRDETVHSDFDDYVSTVTTTRTPDVPSGGVFSVKTRTCITWASPISSRIVVTSQVEWTGRSFIKGIIEKSAIAGQGTYHAELERAMRTYIQEHQTEFIPAGLDPAAVVVAVQPPSAPPTPTAPTGAHAASPDAARKEREAERGQRGLQWAYDTFEGAAAVGRQSALGAIELLRDAWDGSPAGAALYAVIGALVLSNLYTMVLVGRREEVGRRKEARRTEEREKWVQGIVTALWDELAAGRAPPGQGAGMGVGAGAALPQPPAPRAVESWREEVAELARVLDTVEERVRGIRQNLVELD